MFEVIIFGGVCAVFLVAVQMLDPKL